MKLPGEADRCTLTELENDHDFREFLNSGSSRILFVPEPYGSISEPLIAADGGAFAKWLRTNKPEFSVEISKTARKLELRSTDFWLPLVFLASDVGLPLFLNCVANYIY